MLHLVLSFAALVGLATAAPMPNAQDPGPPASDDSKPAVPEPGASGPGDAEADASTPGAPANAAAEAELDLRAQFAALGLELTDLEVKLLERFHVLDAETLAALRAMPIPRDLTPFDPHQLPAIARPHRPTSALVHALAPVGAAAFEAAADDGRLPTLPIGRPLHQLSVVEMATLLRNGGTTSVALTRAHLAHLAGIDVELLCVAALLPERALAQAARMDAEAAAGNWRGPLHGIPYGLKDLVQADGAPTSWGAKPFEGQVLVGDAPLVARLDAAGAVLIAKLSLGALAMGDVWFGGQTKNPWNPKRGSSGSSAGPAAAVAAGGVPFAIGSETLGSIISPSVRCSVTGIRPTLGRVSRSGAMPLSWSMDKLGPIARSVEDAYLVLEAICGDTGLGEAEDAHLVWPDPLPSPLDSPVATREAPILRIGFVPGPDGFVAGWLDELEDALPVGLPVQRVEVDVEAHAAGGYPMDALLLVLHAEAGASFDDLTRDGRDDLLTRQDAFAWPNLFRSARLIPAVEYIQAQRLRTQLARDFEELMGTVDVLVHRPFEGDLLMITNLTGHPCLVLPVPVPTRAQPQAIVLTGRLADEPLLAQVAATWQRTAPRAFPPDFSAARSAPQAQQPPAPDPAGAPGD